MDNSHAIAWTFLTFFNSVVLLNASWAKDKLPAWKRNCPQKNQKDKRAPPFVKADKKTILLPIPKHSKVTLKPQIMRLA